MTNGNTVEGEYQVVNKRGDSFDIGNPPQVGTALEEILSNPDKLVGALGLTTAQASNLRSLIVGGGTGAIHRLLSEHIGDAPAGAIAGFLAGWVVGKVLKR